MRGAFPRGAYLKLTAAVDQCPRLNPGQILVTATDKGKPPVTDTNTQGIVPVSGKQCLIDIGAQIAEPINRYDLAADQASLHGGNGLRNGDAISGGNLLAHSATAIPAVTFAATGAIDIPATGRWCWAA